MKNLVIYYSRKGENYVNGKIKNIDKGNTEYIAEFLKEDLGADSLDLYELTTILSEEYNIDFDVPEEELLKLETVGDVIDFLKKHGVEE